MQMDVGEIVRSYREAKNKSQQVQILEELNACPKEEIEKILSQNVKPQEMPRVREKKSDKSTNNDEISKLKSELEKQKCKVACLEKDKKEISDTVDAYYKEKNEYQCQIKSLQEECQKTYNQMMEVEKEYQSLKAERDTLGKMCDDQQEFLKSLEFVDEPKYDEQSHFIYENELLTTVHILSDELAKLRRQKGL